MPAIVILFAGRFDRLRTSTPRSYTPNRRSDPGNCITSRIFTST